MKDFAQELHGKHNNRISVFAPTRRGGFQVGNGDGRFPGKNRRVVE